MELFALAIMIPFLVPLVFSIFVTPYLLSWINKKLPFLKNITYLVAAILFFLIYFLGVLLFDQGACRMAGGSCEFSLQTLSAAFNFSTIEFLPYLVIGFFAFLLVLKVKTKRQ